MEDLLKCLFNYILTKGLPFCIPIPKPFYTILIIKVLDMNKFNVYTIGELKRKAEVSTSHPITNSFGFKKQICFLMVDTLYSLF